MKFKIFAGLITLLLLSCSDDSVSTTDISQYTGIWVPYEIIYPDGTINQGPFTANSIFGAYAESIKLTEDGTYIPIIWSDENNFLIKWDERGNFKFGLGAQKLYLTDGSWNMEFEVVKFESNNLWLKDSSWETLFKLRREIRIY